MGLFRQIGQRRAEIRKNRPDLDDTFFGRLLRPEHQISLLIACAFVACATAILMLRPNVMSLRVGQYVAHDVVARVDFSYLDTDELNKARKEARNAVPRIYKPAATDSLKNIQDLLAGLPEQVRGQRVDQLPEAYRSILDNTSLAELQNFLQPSMQFSWKATVDEYIATIRKYNLVIIPEKQRHQDLKRMVRVPGFETIRAESTYSPEMKDDLVNLITRPAQQFPRSLVPKIVALTIANLEPNFELDESATTNDQNKAAERVGESDTAGVIAVKANEIILERGEVKPQDFSRLHAENAAFVGSLGDLIWLQRLGLLATVLAISIVGMKYIADFQPKILRNHSRAAGLAALFISMLLLAQLTGLGSTRSYVFGIAPTVMVAMILAIAYDRRFAMGMAALHGILATLALAEDLNFFLIVITGSAACCFLLDDVRTRSKLIEVGGGAAIAMMLVTFAMGWLEMDPFRFILKNAIYSGAAGLAVGFLTLGILPFIERVFRITTSMTLLELADASHPLLRRLAIEAPGTYNHSLQVATLSEEAAEAIGANSLLCRVASYYHDVGKINKAEYFVENQQPGTNRHINLSPSVSLLIIKGHVKDGIELAKEYNLPTSIMPFIQQHHGTTLVEFFYHRARQEVDRNDPLESEVQEHQYRYEGPKPQRKEVAVVMLADCCESACRGMDEPNASRIETLVHELAMKRLLDGQFDESELTMRELELIERSLVKSLLGLYHGRIQYPTESQPNPLDVPTIPASKIA